MYQLHAFVSARVLFEFGFHPELRFRIQIQVITHVAFLVFLYIVQRLIAPKVS